MLANVYHINHAAMRPRQCARRQYSESTQSHRNYNHLCILYDRQDNKRTYIRNVLLLTKSIGLFSQYFNAHCNIRNSFIKKHLDLLISIYFCIVINISAIIISTRPYAT